MYNMTQSISICGSMKHSDRMVEIGHTLEQLGMKVFLPNIGENSDYSSLTEQEATEHKSRMIRDHLEKIKQSDAVLIVNEPLKSIDGYIGANTFLEMGFAYALEKKIYVLNPLPEQPNIVELSGLQPVILKGNFLSIFE
jgi:nucleoside 2-deoxyribosyltransferase